VILKSNLKSTVWYDEKNSEPIYQDEMEIMVKQSQEE